MLKFISLPNIVSRGRWFGLILVLVYTLANADAACTRNTGPIGITAASWSDEAQAALAKPGFNKIGFLTHDGKFLAAHIYRPSHFDAVNGPIWFVMHGVKRNADYYVKTAAPVAERYQVLAIVIEFSHNYYPTSEDYTLGITTHGRSSSRAMREGRYHEPSAYLYNEIERLFEAVRSAIDGKQRGYYLFGHSAGAQFIHRMLTFVPCARVLGAIAANAGWYTLPIEDNRKRFGMPYSLRGGPTEGIDLKALLSMPLILLLGTHDIKGPDADRNVRKHPAAMAQGANRLARGHHYYEISQSLARSLGVSFAWQLVLAPGAEHDVQQVIASAGYLMFDSSKEPICTSSLAGEAGQLVFNEILFNVSNGSNGDAYQGGNLYLKQEQYVEIVNTGNTPVCLAGWTLERKQQKAKHLFPLGEALAPGKALVVFSGGIPIGDFGGSIVQRSTSNNNLFLDSGGGILMLRDVNGHIVKQFSWGDCGGMTCSADYWSGDNHRAIGSLVRSPDANGPWRLHSEVSRAPISPGFKSNGDRW